MPINPNIPKQLKNSLQEMEDVVQTIKVNLCYASPEMQDSFWADLQIELANIIMNVFYANI